VTNNLERRIAEHKSHLIPGFTRKYNIDRLLYFEELPNIVQAIAREKQIKGWTRVKKLALIESLNPEFTDIASPEAILHSVSLHSVPEHSVQDDGKEKHA